MKQQRRVKKLITLMLFLFLINFFIYGDPDDPAPNPTVLPTPNPTTVASALSGDVNMDNRVDIIDALLIAQYYVGLDPENLKNPLVADVNKDDKIDIVDALLVVQYYVGIASGF